MPKFFLFIPFFLAVCILCLTCSFLLKYVWCIEFACTLESSIIVIGHIDLSLQVYWNHVHIFHVSAGHEEKRSSNLTNTNAEVNYHHAPPSPPDSDINAKRHRCSSSADIIYASLRDPFPSTCSSPEDGFSLPLVHSESSKNSTLDSNNKTPLGTANGRNALPHEKICVYPRGPNMKNPEGATVLPFSDDKWVAMKMNPSQ